MFIVMKQSRPIPLAAATAAVLLGLTCAMSGCMAMGGNVWKIQRTYKAMESGTADDVMRELGSRDPARPIVDVVGTPTLWELTDKKGRQDVVHRLVDAGHPPPKGTFVRWALHDPALGRKLLARGVSVDERDDYGATVLMGAAGHGDIELMRFMLDKGAAPGTLTYNHRTNALIAAAKACKLEAARLLLERGVGVDAVGSDAPTALLHAAEQGCVDVAMLLLERGADPNKSGVNRWTAFMYATKNGDIALARELARRGADASVQSKDGMSAERLAKESGNSAIVAMVTQALSGAPVPAAASPTPRAPVLPAPSSPGFSSGERPDDLAVVVGIETYSDIASKAPYAERDADAFKAHMRALGVPERNIVLLKGSKASRSSLVKNLEQWLPRMAKPDSRVYFYFSGHGAPEVKTGQAYLVPWDGDPNFLESTAYSIRQLYQTLGKLPAKQVLVAMDSCFSGAGGRSVLASGARPLVGKIETGVAPARITVLAASASNEISGSLDDKGHGAFTYFLLQGLSAGKTTPQALLDYLTPRVQDEARRLNRDQTPQLQGDGSWSLR
ncbi:MAG: ankyrin repeat domain-containing protein [Elusimicrobia bacterium]|nr:ankyrin repeat domain-containing protein [Elusimicrobiota bacterium]